MLHFAKGNAKRSVATLVLFGTLLTILLVSPPPTAAGSGSYTETFTTTTYRDAGATNATGWGTGALRLPHLTPTLLSSYTTYNHTCGVAVAGGLAYVTDDWAGLQVVNVTNPRQPTLLGLCSQCVGRLAVAGGIAYTAGYAGGLDVINVTNPRTPTHLHTLDTYYAMAVAVAGGIAYVADFGLGLRIINITDPRHPVILSTYLTNGLAIDVCVAGQLAYVAAQTGGLEILNVTNPRAPTLLGSYDTPGYASGVWVEGPYAYVADGDTGLLILNVTNPRAPTLLGSYNTPGGAFAVAVAGHCAYVADMGSGLQLLNITNPKIPTLLGTYNTPGSARDVCVTGSIAYVADMSSGLQILNVTNPKTPTLLGTFTTTDAAYAVYAVGPYAYVGQLSGFWIVNATNPRHPTAVDGCPLSAEARGVWVEGDYAYIANYYGLQVIEVAWNRGRQFEPLARAQSLIVHTATSATLARATLTCTQTVPSETAITYALSPDAGAHWEAVTPGVEHLFTNVGYQPRWRAILTSENPIETPILTSLTIAYETQLNAPSLLTPNADATTGGRPTFQWTAVTGAASYLLQLDTATSFNSPNLRNITVPGGTTSYTPTTPLTDGIWYWRLAANDSAGDLGAFTAARLLHIDATPPAWSQPPADQVVVFGHGFRYDVNASDAAGIDHYWVNGSTFTVDAAGVITNSTTLVAGVYGVEVRAYDPYGNYCAATFTVTVRTETTTTTTTTSPPSIPGFPGLAILVACAAAVSVSLFRRRRR